MCIVTIGEQVQQILANLPQQWTGVIRHPKASHGRPLFWWLWGTGICRHDSLEKCDEALGFGGGEDSKLTERLISGPNQLAHCRSRLFSDMVKLATNWLNPSFSSERRKDREEVLWVGVGVALLDMSDRHVFEPQFHVAVQLQRHTPLCGDCLDWHVHQSPKLENRLIGNWPEINHITCTHDANLSLWPNEGILRVGR